MPTREQRQLFQDRQPRQPVAGGPQGNSVTNAAGRYNRDPGTELARLLDQMEMQKQAYIKGSDVNLQVNPEDVALMQAMQEAALAPAMGRISGNAGARGLTGSSIEGVALGQAAADSALQGQQFLQEQTFRRAGFELSKNQNLFNSLINAGTSQFQLTQGTMGPEKKSGSWLGKLGRGVLGAATGFVTSGMNPIGAVAGAAAGLGGGGADMSSMNQPTPVQPMPNPYDPFDFYGQR